MNSPAQRPSTKGPAVLMILSALAIATLVVIGTDRDIQLNPMIHAAAALGFFAGAAWFVVQRLRQ